MLVFETKKENILSVFLFFVYVRRSLLPASLALCAFFLLLNVGFFLPLSDPTTFLTIVADHFE